MKAQLRCPAPVLPGTDGIAQVKAQLEAKIDALRQELAALRAEVSAISRRQ